MMTPSESLMHSAVRIENKKSNGTISSGTGFFFRLFFTDEWHLPVIVTNKHVIENSEICYFHIAVQDESGLPAYGKSVRVEIQSPKWLGHPDGDIDLAILPIGKFFEGFTEKFGRPFWVGLTPDLSWEENAIRDLLPLDDVIIVGYPNGIWDSKNNLPVFRQGITATPVYLDREGCPEFLVDAAIFPGSSGSPVFLFSRGVWVDRSGGVNAASARVALLGVIHSVALHTATGEIRFEQIPTAVRPLSVSPIPNNLGVCVKAEKILDFERVIMSQSSFQAPEGYVSRGRFVPTFSIK